MSEITLLDEAPTANREQEKFLQDETKSLQNDRLRIETALLQTRYGEDAGLRKSYAAKSFWLAVFWTGFSVFMCGLQFWKPWGKQLAQAEFIAIVATALATIVALYLQVGKGMFSNKN
jgi:ABC-type phosphate/phosphonate transport system permease subunit